MKHVVSSYKGERGMSARIAYEMKYLKTVTEHSTTILVQYTPEYKDKYKKLYNECYYEMREALELEPYDFIQDDSFFESGMEQVYLLLKDDEIIGSVALKGTEIDDLLVDKRFQGNGYGKQLLLWALEHISTKYPTLHVSGWNERAIKLYKSIGFEIIDTIYF